MKILLLLIPIALAIALLSLFAFFWSVKNGQYEDLEGEKYRILEDEE